MDTQLGPLTYMEPAWAWIQCKVSDRPQPDQYHFWGILCRFFILFGSLSNFADFKRSQTY